MVKDLLQQALNQARKDRHMSEVVLHISRAISECDYLEKSNKTKLKKEEAKAKELLLAPMDNVTAQTFIFKLDEMIKEQKNKLNKKLTISTNTTLLQD